MRESVRQTLLVAAAMLAAPSVLLAQTEHGPSAPTTEIVPPPRTNVDPVVLPGSRLQRLLGKAPGHIVAFARTADAWRQIPVQVDERAQLPFKQVLRRGRFRDRTGLFYTDPDTFTGADPDSGFDADDELVLLAADFGPPAPADAEPPTGTKAGARAHLRLTGAADAHAYLFESDGELAPAAGRKRVTYRFALQRGDYKSTYRVRAGINPETSTITTGSYRIGFRDRWIMDELRVTVGTSQGADLLDRHKIQVMPPSCIRTTKTFCMGSGAIVANIDGPIRAIRSVIGANSGPLTERLWICYPDRFDILTKLRVHALPSVFMFFDYSTDARGMRFSDNNNPRGLQIDGKPDAFKQGELLWQFITGKQGSLLIHYLLDTTIKPLRLTSLYDDNLEPKWQQCTGDTHALAASGPVLSKLPNTDPRLAGAKRLHSRVVLYPGAPDRTLHAAAPVTPTPLQVEVR